MSYIHWTGWIQALAWCLLLIGGIGACVFVIQLCVQRLAAMWF